MKHALQIPRRHERLVVRAADAVLRPLTWTRAPRAAPVRRVLLLRLERIGDLLMAIDAIRLVRMTWPEATIDLAVGSWNAPLARMIDGISSVLILDVPWLARGGAGASWPTLIRQARAWSANRYDLVVNFEPDIRSNAIAWLSGAPVRVGYSSGGGAGFLTSAAPYDPSMHVGSNAIRLVGRAARATGTEEVRPPASFPVRLTVTADARQRVRTLLEGRTRPLVGLHASGGRPSKQWHLDRFAEVARILIAERNATIVLTGESSDRQLVDHVRQTLPARSIVDTAGRTELGDLAALFSELDVLVTGDTGPMHLAAAVGAPVVALFGPSDPNRYGPGAAVERVLYADVSCRPCGLVRMPPVRCRGHVPDCLDGIQVETVVRATMDLLDRNAGTSPRDTA